MQMDTQCKLLNPITPNVSAVSRSRLVTAGIRFAGSKTNAVDVEGERMDEKPKLVAATYQQEADSCSLDTQTIEIQILDAGGGDYFQIKTSGWAIDKPEDLLSLFEIFK